MEFIGRAGDVRGRQSGKEIGLLTRLCIKIQYAHTGIKDGVGPGIQHVRSRIRSRVSQHRVPLIAEAQLVGIEAALDQSELHAENDPLLFIRTKPHPRIGEVAIGRSI